MKTLVLALLLLSGLPALAAGPTIDAVQAARVDFGNGLAVSASIRGPKGVFAPMVYWRAAKAKAYTAEGLTKDKDRYAVTIVSNEPVIEYFLEAWDEQGGGPARVGSAKEPLTFPEKKAQAPRRVAVLEFENELDKSEKIDRVYFSDAVRGLISDSKRGLTVMSRENVLVLLSSSGKKLEDCAALCEVETGRLLGADLVVSGRMTKVGRRYKLTLRVHATGEGVLLASAQASGESVEQLDDETGKAVNKLLESVP
ncbi:MAG: hypothetical protein JST92_18850 [Deltaproteobacteria bacterium]|nr:hypothetical protein [Deltaproteobacteria bacterium]